MSDYSKEIEKARKAYDQRQKYRLEQKRIRQHHITRMRKLAIVTAGVFVATAVVIGSLSISRNQNRPSTMNEKETLDVAVDVNTSMDQTLPVKPVMTYPFESPTYQSITDEGVDSAYIALLDINQREVIAGRGYDEKIYPASMTKVMTIIVAVEQLQDMSQTFTFNAELITPLVKQQASRAGFDPGEVITAKDLLYGLILPSGADAAVALATMTAGSEEQFAELMNQKCEDLGLKKTHFTNASGLYDDEQYTTPLEMAMIMEYAMKNQTCTDVLSTYQYRTASTEQHPDGILLTSTMFSRMYGNEVEGVSILAGKTGYVDEAGNCLVTYALKDDKPYVAVLANASYKWHSIFDDFEVYKTYLP